MGVCVCHQLRQGVQESQRPHAHYESDAAAPRDGHGVVERRGDGTVPAGEREGGPLERRVGKRLYGRKEGEW